MPRVARLQSSVGVRPFRPVRGDMILDRTMSGGVIRENRARAAKAFPRPAGGMCTSAMTPFPFDVRIVL
ncbi:hypothetical protein G6F60_015742 [Rhizopus arrhizus]|nr:hypothetical protein G6F60_015742 [Rhizopus arrhizus]